MHSESSTNNHDKFVFGQNDLEKDSFAINEFLFNA